MPQDDLDFLSLTQVDEIPEGFSMETVIWVSQGGVNQAMEEWGRALRRKYQVWRRRRRRSDGGGSGRRSGGNIDE